MKNSVIRFQELDVYLDAKTAAGQLSLKNVIKQQCGGYAIPAADVHLTITVAPQVTVILIDDLFTENDLENSQSLTHIIDVVIHEHSTLSYIVKMIPEMQLLEDSAQIVRPSQDERKNTISKELRFKFVGRHARADVVCSCYGKENNVFVFKTLQDHQVEDTTSSVMIKSVLDDNAKLICNSMIRIHKNAQRTDAQQSNKNIILGKHARAISNPQLEIEASNVKCKHGAAVSKLNSDQIFYLQSRGFDGIQTRTMLIDAFLS